MDILYIVGRGSTWRNNELRYSLRSIAKYGINVGRVFVAGYIPSFVNRESVICVPVEDETDVKHYNIQHAIEKVVESTDIGCNDGGEFLYSSDDHFYIQPTDFANYPYYWRGVDLPSKIDAEDVNKTYHTTLVSTRRVLESFGLPCHHFAWHGNTHFNRKFWLDDKFYHMRKMAYNMPEGCEPTCLMMNYWITQEELQLKVRRDLKLSKFETHATFMTRTDGREVFSSIDDIGTTYMAEFLQKTFAKPCKYEQDIKI